MSDRWIVQENRKRNAQLFQPFDPLTGEGSFIPRFPLTLYDNKTIYLPDNMENDNVIQYFKKFETVWDGYKKISKEPEEGFEMFMNGLTRKRLEMDFEYWAYICSTIQDKESKQEIPFKLNYAQRVAFRDIYEDLRNQVPIRVNLLKARQGGFSTLIENMFAWIQNERKSNWHSAICALDTGQSTNIRHMYTRLAQNYPSQFGSITLKPYEHQVKNKQIVEHGAIIGIASATQPDNLRSYDFSMLHLSEPGYYKTTEGRSPDDLIRTLRNTVPEVPETVIILEGTANGVGNFWHNEWLASENKETSYRNIFIPWFWIERYWRPIGRQTKVHSFFNSFTKYEEWLWDQGASLENINWYRNYKKDNRFDDWSMKTEFPTTAHEAFQSTGRRAIPPKLVERQRETCTDPTQIGELYGRSVSGTEALEDLEFHEFNTGNLYVWVEPDDEISISDRYLVVMDIGGKRASSDKTVIRVFDRYWLIDGGKMEAVATWRGNIDPDLAAWKAAQIATWYHGALLVVESNYFEARSTEYEGSHFLTVLDEIADNYPNLFTRSDPEKVQEGKPVQWGFHMNRHTKPMIIDFLMKYLRDRMIKERDNRVCDEYETFEIKDDGTYGAKTGNHDDLVDATGIACWVSDKKMGTPSEIGAQSRVKKKIVGESSF